MSDLVAHGKTYDFFSAARGLIMLHRFGRAADHEIRVTLWNPSGMGETLLMGK
ncbi:MAG: hypothetical protein ACKVHO_14145 [Verrucomicrobiia bacterium]